MKILGLGNKRSNEAEDTARDAVSASYSSSWADLEPDILGQCFAHLEVDEAER